MKPSNTLVLILVLIGFTSCDPYYRLIVNNPSGDDVKMRIVYDSKDTYRHRRFLDTGQRWGEPQQGDLKQPVYNSRLYITFYDSTDKFCRKEVKQAITRLSLFDSVCNCISFILPAKENLKLEGGIEGPSSQKIIFNDTDIVEVPQSKRVRKKAPLLLGGDYIISTIH